MISGPPNPERGSPPPVLYSIPTADGVRSKWRRRCSGLSGVPRTIEPAPPFTGSWMSGGGPEPEAPNFGTTPAVVEATVGGRYGSGGGTLRRDDHGISSRGVGASWWSPTIAYPAVPRGDGGMLRAGLRCRMPPSARTWSSVRRWWLWAGGGRIIGDGMSSGWRAEETSPTMPACAVGRYDVEEGRLRSSATSSACRTSPRKAETGFVDSCLERSVGRTSDSGFAVSFVFLLAVNTTATQGRVLTMSHPTTVFSRCSLV